MNNLFVERSRIYKDIQKLIDEESQEQPTTEFVQPNTVTPQQTVPNIPVPTSFASIPSSVTPQPAVPTTTVPNPFVDPFENPVPTPFASIPSLQFVQPATPNIPAPESSSQESTPQEQPPSAMGEDRKSVIEYVKVWGDCGMLRNNEAYKTLRYDDSKTIEENAKIIYAILEINPKYIVETLEFQAQPSTPLVGAMKYFSWELSRGMKIKWNPKIKLHDLMKIAFDKGYDIKDQFEKSSSLNNLTTWDEKLEIRKMEIKTLCDIVNGKIWMLNDVAKKPIYKKIKDILDKYNIVLNNVAIKGAITKQDDIEISIKTILRGFTHEKPSVGLLVNTLHDIYIGQPIKVTFGQTNLEDTVGILVAKLNATKPYIDRFNSVTDSVLVQIKEKFRNDNVVPPHLDNPDEHFILKLRKYNQSWMDNLRVTSPGKEFKLSSTLNTITSVKDFLSMISGTHYSLHEGITVTGALEELYNYLNNYRVHKYTQENRFKLKENREYQRPVKWRNGEYYLDLIQECKGLIGNIVDLSEAPGSMKDFFEIADKMTDWSYVYAVIQIIILVKVKEPLVELELVKFLDNLYDNKPGNAGIQSLAGFNQWFKVRQYDPPQIRPEKTFQILSESIESTLAAVLNIKGDDLQRLLGELHSVKVSAYRDDMNLKKLHLLEAHRNLLQFISFTMYKRLNEIDDIDLDYHFHAKTNISLDYMPAICNTVFAKYPPDGSNLFIRLIWDYLEKGQSANGCSTFEFALNDFRIIDALCRFINAEVQTIKDDFYNDLSFKTILRYNHNNIQNIIRKFGVTFETPVYYDRPGTFMSYVHGMNVLFERFMYEISQDNVIKVKVYCYGGDRSPQEIPREFGERYKSSALANMVAKYWLENDWGENFPMVKRILNTNDMAAGNIPKTPSELLRHDLMVFGGVDREDPKLNDVRDVMIQFLDDFGFNSSSLYSHNSRDTLWISFNKICWEQLKDKRTPFLDNYYPYLPSLNDPQEVLREYLKLINSFNQCIGYLQSAGIDIGARPISLELEDKQSVIEAFQELTGLSDVNATPLDYLEPLRILFDKIWEKIKIQIQLQEDQIDIALLRFTYHLYENDPIQYIRMLGEFLVRVCESIDRKFCRNILSDPILEVEWKIFSPHETPEQYVSKMDRPRFVGYQLQELAKRKGVQYAHDKNLRTQLVYMLKALNTATDVPVTDYDDDDNEPVYQEPVQQSVSYSSNDNKTGGGGKTNNKNDIINISTSKNTSNKNGNNKSDNNKNDTNNNIKDDSGCSKNCCDIVKTLKIHKDELVFENQKSRNVYQNKNHENMKMLTGALKEATNYSKLGEMITTSNKVANRQMQNNFHYEFDRLQHELGAIKAFIVKNGSKFPAPKDSRCENYQQHLPRPVYDGRPVRYCGEFAQFIPEVLHECATKNLCITVCDMHKRELDSDDRIQVLLKFWRINDPFWSYLISNKQRNPVLDIENLLRLPTPVSVTQALFSKDVHMIIKQHDILCEKSGLPSINWTKVSVVGMGNSELIVHETYEVLVKENPEFLRRELYKEYSHTSAAGDTDYFQSPRQMMNMYFQAGARGLTYFGGIELSIGAHQQFANFLGNNWSRKTSDKHSVFYNRILRMFLTAAVEWDICHDEDDFNNNNGVSRVLEKYFIEQAKTNFIFYNE